MDERSIVYEVRVNVYALLQRLYQDPVDSELLSWLVSERPFLEFPLELDETAAAALAELDADSLTATVETLRADFRQLFVGPGRMKVPPWESVYRSEDQLLFDQHTLQVREAYARNGMEFVKINEQPEDSIAIELEFMKVLTERLLRAVETNDQTAERLVLEQQQEFLKKHLLIWVPRFTKLTQKHAQTRFYSALAEILNGFMQWENATVTMLLETVTETE